MVTVYKTKEDEFMADYRDYQDTSIYEDIAIFIGGWSLIIAPIMVVYFYIFNK